MNATGSSPCISPFFFFNDTATTEIYTLSLHDALPISCGVLDNLLRLAGAGAMKSVQQKFKRHCRRKRSEEHTSELQSRQYLVCRLLLEKKKSMRKYDCDRRASKRY